MNFSFQVYCFMFLLGHLFLLVPFFSICFLLFPLVIVQIVPFVYPLWRSTGKTYEAICSFKTWFSAVKSNFSIQPYPLFWTVAHQILTIAIAIVNCVGCFLLDSHASCTVQCKPLKKFSDYSYQCNWSCVNDCVFIQFTLWQ